MLVQQDIKKIINNIYEVMKLKYPKHKITKTLIHDICDYQFKIVENTIEAGEKGKIETYNRSIWLPYIGSFLFKEGVFNKINEIKNGK